MTSLPKAAFAACFVATALGACTETPHARTDGLHSVADAGTDAAHAERSGPNPPVLRSGPNPPLAARADER